ncbi:DUF4342 domain-containing protein [Patescibacteria group bacterium]|nr:DUF4342 domain-containing protein [Patescibacteria group bacterium]MBP9710595.1 DUF4342 domain-containing protein [Patescibacteria group bacterium]
MNNQESFRVNGQQLVDKIKEIVKEGNARRILIQNEQGETILEIPLTIAVIGTLLVPVIAAVSALAALAVNYTIVVEKKNTP